jgi:hypothetical protein
MLILFSGATNYKICTGWRNATLFTRKGSDFASKPTSHVRFVHLFGSTCIRDFLFFIIAPYRLLVRFLYLVQPTNPWSLLDQPSKV